jgi:hypothetical protein
LLDREEKGEEVVGPNGRVDELARGRLKLLDPFLLLRQCQKVLHLCLLILLVLLVRGRARSMMIWLEQVPARDLDAFELARGDVPPDDFVAAGECEGVFDKAGLGRFETERDVDGFVDGRADAGEGMGGERLGDASGGVRGDVEGELSLEMRVWLDDVSDSSVSGREGRVVGKSGRKRSWDEGGERYLHKGPIAHPSVRSASYFDFSLSTPVSMRRGAYESPTSESEPVEEADNGRCRIFRLLIVFKLRYTEVGQA